MTTEENLSVETQADFITKRNESIERLKQLAAAVAAGKPIVSYVHSAAEMAELVRRIYP